MRSDGPDQSEHTTHALTDTIGFRSLIISLFLSHLFFSCLLLN